jgi:hypothetical protein
MSVVISVNIYVIYTRPGTNVTPILRSDCIIIFPVEKQGVLYILRGVCVCL